MGRGALLEVLRECRKFLTESAQMPWERPEPKEDEHESWMKYMAQCFLRSLKARARRVNAWIRARRGPIIQAAILVMAGAAGAYAFVASAGFHAVGMVGVGVGVGAAAGSVALVFGAVIGLAIFGLIALRRAVA